MVRVAKRPSTEDALLAIRAIRDAPEAYDLKRDLAPFLLNKTNHAAAAAADTIGRLEAVTLTQELVAAFLFWMKNPAKLDPGSKALTAIAKTLAAMDCPASEVYLKGIRHVQMEASFGPPVDTAAALRGLCAQGLARMSHPDALLECVTLVTDREIAARSGAVRAISETGQPAAVLLLRFKALVGDDDEEVMAECFAGLLRLAPAETFEFVARFLSSPVDEIAERAALALGESHLASAFPVLQQAWEQTTRATLRKTLLLAMAMLRQDEAVEFLLTRLADDSEKSGADALAALALYSRDDSVRTRIQELLAQRNSAPLNRAFGEHFER